MDEFGHFTDLNSEGLEKLIIAIVKQAVSDWKDAMRVLSKLPDSKSAENRRLECETFFLSQYFYLLTGIDGQTMLKKLEEDFNAS